MEQIEPRADDVEVADARPAPPASPNPVLAVLSALSPRTWVRIGFLAVFAWSCLRLWQFYQWALGQGQWVPRPEATSGFVPLGAFMSLFAWLRTGMFDTVMPAAIVILIGGMLLSLLLKRAFCGYVCPVGASVSFFAWLGRKAFPRGFRVPRWLDIALKVPKYPVAAFLLFQFASLPPQVALEFQQLPYYASADLKILYTILHPSPGYIAFAAFIGLTSMLWGNTWCRYLCPLGALYGALGAASPASVTREESACISCAKCAKACHARIPVDRLRTVRAAECDGCQDCVRVCPQPGALSATLLGRFRFPWQAWPLAVVALWLFVVAVALVTGHWTHGLPDELVAQYMRIMKLTPDF